MEKVQPLYTSHFWQCTYIPHPYAHLAVHMIQSLKKNTHKKCPTGYSFCVTWQPNQVNLGCFLGTCHLKQRLPSRKALSVTLVKSRFKLPTWVLIVRHTVHSRSGIKRRMTKRPRRYPSFACLFESSFASPWRKQQLPKLDPAGTIHCHLFLGEPFFSPHCSLLPGELFLAERWNHGGTTHDWRISGIRFEWIILGPPVVDDNCEDLITTPPQSVVGGCMPLWDNLPSLIVLAAHLRQLHYPTSSVISSDFLPRTKLAGISLMKIKALEAGGCLGSIIRALLPGHGPNSHSYPAKSHEAEKNPCHFPMTAGIDSQQIPQCNSCQHVEF